MASTPGLLFVQSRIFKPDLVSPALFIKWYEDIHVHDVLGRGGIQTGNRWKRADVDDNDHVIHGSAAADEKEDVAPHLNVYPLDDVGFLRSPDIKGIPETSDLLPGPSHYIWDFVAYNARVYEHRRTFEGEGTEAGPGNWLVAWTLTPSDSTEPNLEKWYNDEHCTAVAKKCTGFRRTRLYRMHYDSPQKKVDPEDVLPSSVKEPAVWLIMYEFDGEATPPPLAQIKAAATQTELGAKTVDGLVKSDTTVFKRAGAYGDVGKKW